MTFYAVLRIIRSIRLRTCTTDRRTKYKTIYKEHYVTFNDLGLGKACLAAVKELGFIEPTAVQEKVIPKLLTGNRDIIALSQTGTGKTAAFGLPIAEKMDLENRSTQALILAPTRELCRQITSDIESYGRHIPGLRIVPVYGGSDMNRQIKMLKSGAHVLVATPGRLLDMIRRDIADISHLQYLVLDEADIMLDMGFKEDLDAILSTAPAERHTVLFSATMPESVYFITRTYMSDPEEITVGKKNTAAENVEHTHFVVDKRDKYHCLKRVLDYHPDIYGIVFCRTKRDTQEIADKLLNDGYDADSLHGDLSQSQREYVMKKFRDMNVRILVATDIAARGLDVTDLTHIIHFQLPEKTEIYTHRSGRTGRAGKSGESIAFVEPKERYRLKRIEKSIRKTIQEGVLPKTRDILERRLHSLIESIKKTPVDGEMMDSFKGLIDEGFADMSKEDLAARLLSLQARHILEYYRKAPEPAEFSKPARRREFEHAERAPKRNRPANRKNTRRSNLTYLTINLGKKDKLLPPQLIGLINQSTRDRRIAVGNIDIGTKSTRFEIEERSADTVADALNNFTYNNRRVSVGRLAG